MRQQDVFKKIGNILQELNEQYDYLKTQTDNIDDLELELFAANSHFLSDHLEILRKLNLQLTKSLPPHQPSAEILPQASFQPAEPELVVEPPVAFAEEVPEQHFTEIEAPTLEEYYDIEEPAGEEPGETTPEFVFDFVNEKAGPQEEQNLAAEPQYELVTEQTEEAYTEPEYQHTEHEETIEIDEPSYQTKEPVATEKEEPVDAFEEPEVDQEDPKAEKEYLFHTDTEETTPEVDEPEEDVVAEAIPEKEPELFSFEIPTNNPEPEINIEPETGRDTFSFIRTEPEVLRNDLTLDEAETFASADKDEAGTINASYRDEAQTGQEPQHTPLQEQTFAEPEPDVPETMVTPTIETESTPEPKQEVPAFTTPPQTPTYTATPEPMPTYQLNRQPEPQPTPAAEPERPLTLNERISAQRANNTQATPSALPPIKDLKGAITLNDKMLFVRDLFNGYSLAYSEAIEILNRFNNFDDAERFLNSNYVEKNRWADKPGTTEKFFELLKRRFA
ncbi:hypothetical protein [Mucilaginibacter agri]|uniref:Uncharacterized protein n=1 Tax=Mucilaginibacter agri TaxID=2695265 RepID=A0A966DUS4_9SPHI|nr:hypothetical protein [Mucilaginibacter agri]NCD70732.1 hypothetical protein [Mucilaginibacter agri]